MNEFYLNLPSNTQKALGASRENTTSEFRVRLPKDIRLKGDWEVALVEVQHPNSWDNVPEGENKIIVLYAERQNPDSLNIASKIVHLFVQTGYYDDPESLIRAIENAIEHRIDYPTVGDPELRDIFFHDYDHIRRRFIIGSKDPKYNLQLSDTLAYMMGYKYNVISGFGMAEYPPDMRGGIDSIYVYCDLVEPQIVGDSMEPLLRILPVSGNYGDIVHRVFDSPHYVDVLQKEFSSVGISIKTDRDLPVPFRFGKSVVKLHFRRKL
jgi:hypothetical protein